MTRPEEIAAIVVVSRGGIPVRVGDVARVAEGRDIRRGAVTADGKGERVLGLGFMLMGDNSHLVTRRELHAERRALVLARSEATDAQRKLG